MSANPLTPLWEPEGIRNPYPIYDAIRSAAPVAWIPYLESSGGRWVVTGYEAADQILKDPRVWKDAGRMGYEDESLFAKSMLFQDAPDHTRLRGLVNRAFTPAMVARLAPRIEEIIAWLLEGMADSPVDFVSQFALPLPIIVIAEILGVPAQDRDRFRAWSRALIGSSPEDGAAATEAVAGYFDHLIRTRQGKPGDDLLSQLIGLEAAGDRLSHQELLGMCVLMLVAGHETTVNLLGNGLDLLIHHSEAWRRLQQEPGLVETAVEEMLRYEAPVQWATYRYAGAPIPLAGETIEPGHEVAVILAAANRDPAAFSHPHQFQVGRQPNRHLSFGRGVHVCLGAPVARLEARLAFQALLARFRRIEGDGEPVRRMDVMFRGFDQYPVRLTPR